MAEIGSGGNLRRTSSWRPPRPRRDISSPRRGLTGNDDGIVENATAMSSRPAHAARTQRAHGPASPALRATDMLTLPGLPEGSKERAHGRPGGSQQRSLPVRQPARRRSAHGRRGIPPSLRTIPPVTRVAPRAKPWDHTLPARRQPAPHSLSGAPAAETPSVPSPWRARLKDEPAPLQLSPIAVPSMRALRMSECVDLLEKARASATRAQSPHAIATSVSRLESSSPARPAAGARASWPTAARLRRKPSGGPPSLRGMLVHRAPSGRSWSGLSSASLRREIGEVHVFGKRELHSPGSARPATSPMGGESWPPSATSRSTRKRVSFLLED